MRDVRRVRTLALRAMTVGAMALALAAPLSSPLSAQSAGASPGITAAPSVSRGLALLSAFKDSLPGNSGNGLRCTSCHLDNGTKATSMSWFGTAQRYPRYRSRKGSEESLAERVNECIARSLAGRMLPEDGREMLDIIAYLDSLGGVPRPANVDTVKLVGNLASGRRVYANSCARCHGVDGSGSLMPAVWGAKSYSIGAGLARQTVLATFVRWNMPYDQKDTLTHQQAADVAAYVLSRPRQDHPGKEKDWPKGDPPADVAYATESARKAGKPLPAARPLLRRRVTPTPRPSASSSR